MKDPQAPAPQPVTKRAGLSALPAVNRLFVNAVRTNFTYFPADIQNRVIREHSLFKLLLAYLHPRRILLVAKDSRQTIGYAIGSVPRRGSGQFYWLYVHPGHRGGNIGLKLLSRMLREQARLGASEVTLATHDHRRYYERQGFKYRDTKLQDGVTLDIMTYKIQ